MSCAHEYMTSPQSDYEVCIHCGTYHSLKSLPPSEIYAAEYWSERWGHNTFKDHQHNVDVHQEQGITKNDFILTRIAVSECEAALEIACAPGNLLRKLREKAGFKRVVGVEVDATYMAEMLEIAGPEIDLIFGYFPEATRELNSASFNLIVGLDIFEHMHDPNGFLRECKRLLKPNGQLMLMLPLMKEGFQPRFFHPIEHVFLHSPRHVEQLLDENGFGPPTYDKWTDGHETISATKL